MDVSKLKGESFEHFSISDSEKHCWTVSKVNPETDYVFVERQSKDGKIGQWVPGAWIAKFKDNERLSLKVDSMRKSRDYFKNERDDLNIRIATVSANLTARNEVLTQELDFVQTELSICEKDLNFWKSICLYGVICFLGIAAVLVLIGGFSFEF